MFPLQDLHKILLHINVDRAVTGKCTASFDVAGECGDEVRILDQFVDVDDEGTAGHMASGYSSIKPLTKETVSDGDVNDLSLQISRMTPATSRSLSLDSMVTYRTF